MSTFLSTYDRSRMAENKTTVLQGTLDLLILKALSAGFALLYLFGGLLGIYFIRKKMSTDLLKGYLNISILVYGINFIVTAYFTFIFPIAFTGLVLIALVLARFTLKAK